MKPKSERIISDFKLLLHFCFFPKFYNEHATCEPKVLCNINVFLFFFGQERLLNVLGSLLPPPPPNYHFLSIFPQLSPPSGGWSAFSPGGHGVKRAVSAGREESRSQTTRLSFCSGASGLPTLLLCTDSGNHKAPPRKVPILATRCELAWLFHNVGQNKRPFPIYSPYCHPGCD